MNTATPSLLLLEASPRGERSHSRRLGQEYLAAPRAAHPAGRTVVRDLGHEPPPFVTEAWVEGAFTPPAGHSDAARAEMRVSDAYVDELFAATEITIATPMYNFTVPAALKAWIDQVVRFGRTFSADANGYKGLVSGKRVRILVASGGDYRPGTPANHLNHLEPYLRMIFGFIGITDVSFVYAHSLNQDPAAREKSVTDATTATKSLAAA